jgi:hypothetical protein
MSSPVEIFAVPQEARIRAKIIVKKLMFFIVHIIATVVIFKTGLKFIDVPTIKIQQ